ncbi:MAG: Ig-like domain-containing domain [Chitinophagales bacterium]
MAISVIAMIAGCANIQAPTGGPRDTDPPKIKWAKPANKSLYFQQRKIQLRFNEYIQTTINPQEIVISPPQNKPPRVYAEGKSVYLKLDDDLKPNTTYTINFGESIKDNNEANPLKNLTYVFSTGAVLDSARAHGTITDAQKLTPVDNVVVALYPADSANTIKTAKPYYFAQTEKDGTFKLENIKPGKYQAFGLIDQNLNYIYDQPNEQVGFSSQLFEIGDTLNPEINFLMFHEDEKRPRITEATALFPGCIRLAFSGPVTTFRLDADILDTADRAYANATKDTITYWYTKRYANKTTLFTVLNDSLRDTTRIDLPAIATDSLRKNKSFLWKFENQPVKGTSDTATTPPPPLQSPFKPVKMIFQVPLRGIVPGKTVQVVQDSAKKSDSALLLWQPAAPRELEVKFPFQEKHLYTIILPDSSVMDYSGRPNSAMNYVMQTEPKENFGTILLSVKFDHPERHYIFKILSGNNEPVATFYYTGNTTQKIKIPNVHAGSYKLQAIEDDNKNGEWDSGNVDARRQPERIINFKETYELKGNWELEIDVKL